MLRVAAPALALLLLLAVAAEQGRPQQCAAEGACESDEDASLLQTKPERRAAAGSPLERALTANVWLTTVNNQAEAVKILKKGDPISFQSSGARMVGSAAAPAPTTYPSAPRHEDPPAMTCQTIDGVANRDCQILPPNPNSSFLQQRAAARDSDSDRTWKNVNGGTNQACRGDNPNDNSDAYYLVTTATTIKNCRKACKEQDCCTGIEYSESSGRCELWTKKIKSSASVSGYKCMKWAPMPNCGVWDGITRVTVDVSKPKQTMRGFGAAMTQSSAYVLKELKKKDKALYDELMNRLFDRGNKAAGISMVRFPIGSCDYAKTERTYADVPQPSCSTSGECATSCSQPGNACDPIATGQWQGQAGNCQGGCGSSDCGGCSQCASCCCVASDYPLDTFALDPETEKIVEVLQDAKKIRPDLVIMGSPWTPPRWLKKQGTLAGNSKENTLLGGASMDAYAQYFKKVKDKFKAEGIPIDYFTLQNEPLYPPSYPGMYLSADDYGLLAKKVQAAIGDYPRLLAYDHNWDNPQYPLDAIKKAGAGVFNGTAFHCYAGSMSSAHGTVSNAHPELDIMMTECTGSYPNQQCNINKGMESFGWNHEWDMNQLFLNNILHGGSASVKWIMTLDQNCGPYLPSMHFHWGRPLVSIPDSATKIGDMKFNQDFWTVSHMGRFVRPGSQLVETTVTAGGGASLIGAFRDTAAAQVVLLAVNKDHSNALNLEIDYNGQTLTYSVPKWGTAVLRWDLA